MMTLWIIFAAMLLLAIMILLWPIAAYKGSKATHPVVSQKQENIDIFQERLAELENEQTQGNLDESSFLHLKTELEKSLLGDVRIEEMSVNKQPGNANAMQWLVMGGMACVFAIASLLTYQSLGASDEFEKYLALGDQPATPAQHATNKAAPDFAAAVTALKAKLAENPQNIDNWFLLANSYMAMGDYPKAAAVYKKMATIIGSENPGYATAKAAYAQTMFQLAGEKMTTEVQQALDDALKVDPAEPTALILVGLNNYQNQQYTQAITAWKKAKVNAGKAQIERFIGPAIIEARRQMGEAAPVVAKPQQQQTATSASITIHLDISPTFKARLNPEQRIFVFAKAKMPMPLAAERLQVKDLPITIVLDDTKAAMPTAKISSAEFVEITARVALSGSPRAAKGDLYATAKQVAVHKGVELTLMIDKVVD